MPRGARAYERVYELVKRIPRGRVATYGQIAATLGLPGGARQVGYAMAALPSGSVIPWHRVVNAKGAVSLPGPSGVTQRMRLEKEGALEPGRRHVDLATKRAATTQRAGTTQGAGTAQRAAGTKKAGSTQ